MSGPAERIARALAAGEIEVTRLAEGSGVVLHVPSLRSRTLNPTGMELLDALAADADCVDALAGLLVAKQGIDHAVAYDDAEAFVAALLELLTPSDGEVAGGRASPERTAR